MANAQIRINKTKELTAILEALRQHFRLMSDAELVKLALPLAHDFLERQRRDSWIASLPYMELSDEEQASLTEGIKSLEQAKKDGTLKPMTPEELMEEIRNTPDA